MATNTILVSHDYHEDGQLSAKINIVTGEMFRANIK